jgi:hypothetical protein
VWTKEELSRVLDKRKGRIVHPTSLVLFLIFCKTFPPARPGQWRSQTIRVEVTPRFGIDNFGLALSVATSEHGVPLLPISIEDDLLSIVSRRLKGKQPTLDLMIGYRRMATHRGS